MALSDRESKIKFRRETEEFNKPRFGRRGLSKDNLNSDDSVISGVRVETIKAEPDGGDGDGFELVTFDVVKANNTTAQYQWRAAEVV